MAGFLFGRHQPPPTFPSSRMNSRLTALLAVFAIFLASAPGALAREKRIDPAAAVADAVIVRPVGVVVTVVSSAIFVVALPFAAMANKVPETAESLVARPARAMFCRQLGDFRKMRHENVGHPTDELPRYYRKR
jgi:hypothetical protein